MDAAYLLVLCFAAAIGVYEHRDAAAAVRQRLAACSIGCTAYHGLILCIVWCLSLLSVNTGIGGMAETGPGLFTNQALMMALFWIQEAATAIWTKRCLVSWGMLLLSALSLAARVLVIFACDAYLPDGPMGTGFHQGVEFCTLVIVIVLLTAVSLGLVETSSRQTVSAFTVAIVLLSVGVAYHVHLKRAHELFWDMLWAIAMYLDCVSLLPQLEELAASRGHGLRVASALPLVIHRALTLMFWSESYGMLPPWKSFVIYSLQVNAAGLLALVLIGHLYQKVCSPANMKSFTEQQDLLENAGMKEEPTLNQMF